MAEIFKLKIGLSTEHMFLSFYKHILSPGQRISATKYGIETSFYLVPKLRNLVPNKNKAITSIVDFKAKIKTGAINQIGFI